MKARGSDQKSMKIIGNFIYILRYWPRCFMLSTVTTTMDMPDPIDFLVAKLSGLSYPAASSSEELPSASCRSQPLRTKILLLLRQA